MSTLGTSIFLQSCGDFQMNFVSAKKNTAPVFVWSCIQTEGIPCFLPSIWFLQVIYLVSMRCNRGNYWQILKKAQAWQFPCSFYSIPRKQMKHSETIKDFTSPVNKLVIHPAGPQPTNTLTSTLGTFLFVFILQLLRCWLPTESTQNSQPPLHLKAWNRSLFLTEKSHLLTSSPAVRPEEQTLELGAFVWVSVWGNYLTSFRVFLFFNLVFPENSLFYVSPSKTPITWALLFYSQPPFLSPFSPAS